jgi:hypothetical protein
MKFSMSIVLMFLLFSIPLFALESEPSETVGYVKYECLTTATSTNLNVVALPMDTDITNVTDLANELGVADQIAVWNQAGQNWNASAPIGPSWIPNTDLSPGDVVLVSVTSAVDFYCAGALPDPAQYNLVYNSGNTSLNTIMIPLNRSDIIDVTTLAGSIGVADQIAVWNQAGQNWNASAPIGPSWIPNTGLDIAHPVLISVTGNLTWPVRGSYDVTEKLTDKGGR